MYCRYSLSYRDIEEILKDRRISVDHSTIRRWVATFSTILESEFRKRKKLVGTSWRMDETYTKVNGKWNYLYRACDKEGNTIDFLLSSRRDKNAANRLFDNANLENAAANLSVYGLAVSLLAA